ncbi:hypothetical protein BH09VER1_BH09VER1_48500 [soil metagenome]
MYQSRGSSSFTLSLIGAACLSFVAAAGSAHAGTAIASDNHGGFTVRYGHFSQAELQASAIAALKKTSKYPKSIYIYTYNAHHGYGCVLRYTLKGVPGIVGRAGWPTAAAAANSGLAAVRKVNGVKPVVASKWLEE